MLLITDIGRDIDDTLALLALHGYGRILKLVGVVATGGAGRQRAAIATGWLRRLGYHGNVPPVAACDGKGNTECVIPRFAPSLSDAGLYNGTAADLIARLLRAYSKRLRIVVIAPFTPLAALARRAGGLELLRSNAHSLWIQGQFVQDESSGQIVPNEEAYNIRIDLPSARYVFRHLQNDVEFCFIGKHAVYELPLTKAHFEAWGDEMTVMARNNLEPFRERDPELFRSLYGSNCQDGDDWFSNIEKLSNPYDAIVIAALVDDTLGRKLFPFETTRPNLVAHRSVGNSAKSPKLHNAPKIVADVVWAISNGLLSVDI